MTAANLNNPPSPYVGTDAAAAFLGLEPATLRQWRFLKKGPSYRKPGGRVVYRVADLVAWMESGAVGTTDQPIPAVAA